MLKTLRDQDDGLFLPRDNVLYVYSDWHRYFFRMFYFSINIELGRETK